MSPRLPLLLLLAALACGGERRPPQSARTGGDSLAAGAVPATDSVILALPDSAALVAGFGRIAHSAAGDSCIERALLVRRNGLDRSIPLLYTAEAPVLVNDTTLRAVLYRDCAPADTYRINLRTGFPEPGGAP